MDVCLYYKCYAGLIVVCNDAVVSIFGIFMIMIMNLGDIDIGLSPNKSSNPRDDDDDLLD